ncbi:CBM_collapsed_G0023590.mRNA.1.CDS.1 [Saccharomyces cerevisiae]|nr:CBM_collapsed_G0023590.mRNA.1.CDS.1 [Saccharomyces cerevisiae]
MNKYLEKHHTDEVYIVGVALEYCVKATAISAAELGYKTTVLLDYTRPISDDPEVINKVKEELKAHNINVVDK